MKIAIKPLSLIVILALAASLVVKGLAAKMDKTMKEEMLKAAFEARHDED